MEIQIEDATLKHLDKLVDIENQCFTSEAFSRQQIAYLITDYNTISLVAKVNGEIAGFVILQLDTQDDVVFGHIITLNVASSFRKKGVAQRLLGECEELLKSRNVLECHLEVRQDNVAAIKLYRRLGYVELGLLKGYYGRKHGLYLKKNF